VGASPSLSPLPSRARSFDFQTFPAAVGLALIAGGLALAAPFLNSLVGALAALAVAGWVVDRRPVGRESVGRTAPTVRLGWVCVGMGALIFFALPPPAAAARGLLLAGSFLPLWLADRRTATSHPARAVNP
jgi:hypothetical protein